MPILYLSNLGNKKICLEKFDSVNKTVAEMCNQLKFKGHFLRAVANSHKNNIC